MLYSQGLDPTLILTETEDEDEDEGDASFDSTSSYFLGEVGELELEVEAATGTPQWAEVRGVLSHLLASLATPGTHSPLVVAEAAAAITDINPDRLALAARVADVVPVNAHGTFLCQCYGRAWYSIGTPKKEDENVLLQYAICLLS